MPSKKTSSKSKKSSQAKYLVAIGRRKTATARVRLYPHKKGEIEVNGKPIQEYFPGKVKESLYLSPLRTCNVIGKYLITVKVQGSGKVGQVIAVIHALARVLVKLDEKKFRPVLKKRGFLTRDPRMKERRKAGTGGKARRQKQSPKR
jgi:small subunit ribosomal protein S9